MDLYLSSLLLGAAGLGVMALSGLGSHGAGAHGHAGGQGHAGGGAHGGGGHAGGAHLTGSQARGGGHAPPAPGGAQRGNTGTNALWLIASPRFLFSFLLGVGTAGLVGRPFLGGPLLLAAAIAGGVLFERLLVSPLWNLSMRFASNPASTLESAVSDEAIAVTSFDTNGQGIVSVEVDGQIVQILATLRGDDRTLTDRACALGQRVRIDEVDADERQ